LQPAAGWVVIGLHGGTGAEAPAAGPAA